MIEETKIMKFKVRKGVIEKISKFLNKDGQLDLSIKDSDGRNAFNFFVDLDYIKIVKRLLKKGVDINTKDNYGRTPLINAVRGNQIKMVKLLVSHEADINIQDNKGWTAIRYATYHDFLDIVKYLVENKYNKLDINFIDEKGLTILHYLIDDYDVNHYLFDYHSRQNKLNTIKYLVKRGADFTIEDKKGLSPYNHANNDCSWKILECFDEVKIKLNVNL